MGDNTKIEWADATWNPVTGCTKVSPGCDHCYIDRTPVFRIEHRTFAGATGGTHVGASTDVRLHEERLDQPLRWRRPRRIFVNSLSDLFHKEVPDEYIAQVWAVMSLAPRHRFMVLTKRHGRMRSLLASPAFAAQVRQLIHDCAEPDGLTPGVCACGHPLKRHNGLGYCLDGECVCDSAGRGLPTYPAPNIWLGVTVEDQERADLRIPALLSTPAAVRFLSCEPLLGSVHLDGSAPLGVATSSFDRSGWLAGIDWVIAGGESGKEARPSHPIWFTDLRDQCVAAGVAFLFKQWGEWAPPGEAEYYEGPRAGGLTSKTPIVRHRSTYLDMLGQLHSTNELHTFRIPKAWAELARVGKRNAGRKLEGRTWDEEPQ